MSQNYDYPRPMQGRLAKQQLASAAFHASRMYDVLDDDDKLPAWVLMKVNTAEDRLRAAADYLRYKAKPGLDAYDAAVVKRGMHAGYGALGYGYPTIRSKIIEDEPYLCVSYRAEQQYIQPARLLAAAVGGPLVVYAAQQLPKERKSLRLVTSVVGATISAWSAWVWYKANNAMTPVTP